VVGVGLGWGPDVPDEEDHVLSPAGIDGDGTVLAPAESGAEAIRTNPGGDSGPGAGWRRISE
jgi:hypothetical protein